MYPRLAEFLIPSFTSQELGVCHHAQLALTVHVAITCIQKISQILFFLQVDKLKITGILAAEHLFTTR